MRLSAVDFKSAATAEKSLGFIRVRWGHVGKHYDLEVDGRPMRIVLVGQEYGQAYTCVDLCGRSTMIATSAQDGFKRRNPHMRGVTSTLRLLVWGARPAMTRLVSACLTTIYSTASLW